MVAGHPFKGLNGMSIGQLAHPDLKRFQMNTSSLFAPPNPAKVMGASMGVATLPAFAAFFQSSFGGNMYIDSSNDKCGMMFQNMKKCYDSASTRSEDPESSCSYYIDGFRRMACSN